MEPPPEGAVKPPGLETIPDKGFNTSLRDTRQKPHFRDRTLKKAQDRNRYKPYIPKHTRVARDLPRDNSPEPLQHNDLRHLEQHGQNYSYPLAQK